PRRSPRSSLSAPPRTSLVPHTFKQSMLYVEEGAFIRIATFVAYAQHSLQLRSHWQSRPHIHQSQRFPHHRQHILRIPPPVVRVKWIAWRCPHNQARIVAHQLSPQRLHPARMLWRCNNNNCVLSTPLHVPRNLLHFFLRIGDSVRKNLYRGIRHALLHQNLAVIFFLANEMDSQRGQLLLRASRPADLYRLATTRALTGAF